MLNEMEKPLKGSRVLVLGVAYKPNVGDLRESPALDIIHLLQGKGADVVYHDPFVPSFRHDEMTMASIQDLDTELTAADCTVIVTDHATYDWDAISERAQVLVDTRNAVRRNTD